LIFSKKPSKHFAISTLFVEKHFAISTLFAEKHFAISTKVLSLRLIKDRFRWFMKGYITKQFFYFCRLFVSLPPKNMFL